MLKSMITIKTLVWIYLEKVCNQIFGRVTDGAPDRPIEGILSGFDLVNEVVHKLGVEGLAPTEHCEENAPRGPHVDQLSA